MPRTDDQPCREGRDQPEEGDRTHQGRRRGAEHQAGEGHQHPGPPGREAESSGELLPQGQGVHGSRQQERGQQPDPERSRRGDHQIQRPRRHGPRVPETELGVDPGIAEQHERGDGGDDRAPGGPHQHDANRVVPSPPGPRRPGHHQSAEERARQGDQHHHRDRQGPDETEADCHGAGCARVDPQQPRLRQRVAGQCLHQHPGDPEGGAGHQRYQGPGAAHPEHDEALLTGAAAGEHRQHLPGRHIARSEQERRQDQAGQEDRQPEQHPGGSAHLG